MQADREDADVLFQTVLFLRDKRLSPSTAAGASAAVTARYKGKRSGLRHCAAALTSSPPSSKAS